MMRKWRRSLGFYWQVFFFMVFASGGVIAFAEGVLEPLFLEPLVARIGIGEHSAEALLWAVSVLFPALALGFLISGMVRRKLRGAMEAAQKLSRGDLGARIASSGDGKDAFNRLAAAFNDMADSLERLMYFEKRLLADISHELRSPLTRMGVAAALLPMQRDSDDSDGFDATIKRLETEIQRMSEMVGLLLKQGRGRLEDGNECRPVDLGKLVAECAESYAQTAAKENKRLIVAIEPEMIVRGRELRAKTIIDNIIANAIFYSPKNSGIEVTGKRENGKAVLSVRDSGAGVPENRLRDIFKPFFRADPSRARTSGGAGLGLALAKDAAVAMGGDIGARNANPGLEVLVTLPLETSSCSGK